MKNWRLYFSLILALVFFLAGCVKPGQERIILKATLQLNDGQFATPTYTPAVPPQPPTPIPTEPITSQIITASPTPDARQMTLAAIMTADATRQGQITATPTPGPTGDNQNQFQSATPTPWLAAPTTTPSNSQLGQGQDPLNFEAILQGGEWTKFTLGPVKDKGGYVVDITPLEPSMDGAAIEHKVLPEYRDRTWYDVLWISLTPDTDPLRVAVHAYPTTDWPVVFKQTLKLNPGDWQGMILREADNPGGYVVEINPISKPGQAAGFEKTAVQPEFPAGGIWYDVLRIQASPNQPVLVAEVIVYRTPDLVKIQDFEVELSPGVWTPFIIQPASAETAYIVEVTPLVKKDNQIERFIVQQEFNGQEWNDVLRLLVPGSRPPMKVHVVVYSTGAPPSQ